MESHERRRPVKNAALLPHPDASGFWQKMRKSLGSKRKELGPEHIDDITKIFGDFKKVTRAGVPISRIFKNEDFGYRTITVEWLRTGKRMGGNRGGPTRNPHPQTELRSSAETRTLEAEDC